MRKTFSLLGAVALVAVLATGCAGPEKKLGRGFANLFEIARGGEMSRSIEQTSYYESADVGMTTGAIRGISRTLARTGIGLYEIVTFPIPSYDPVATKYLTPNPVYPDSYKPGLPDESIFATDTYIGFSGGDVAPWSPGSRFKVYNN